MNNISSNKRWLNNYCFKLTQTLNCISSIKDNYFSHLLNSFNQLPWRKCWKQNKKVKWYMKNSKQRSWENSKLLKMNQTFGKNLQISKPSIIPKGAENKIKIPLVTPNHPQSFPTFSRLIPKQQKFTWHIFCQRTTDAN